MIISVVIPTMNKSDLLGMTLAALMDQEIGGDQLWEIVVVDDGSTDGTGEFLKKLVVERGDSNPALHVVSPGVNLGRARARNLGARKAQGRWMLFLDDDIVAPPGLIKEHVELLSANPGYGTIGYAVTDPALVDAPHFYYLDTRGVARCEPGPVPARFFVTQNAAVPRQPFLSVGGFDEEFSGYGFEDMEVAIRMEAQANVHFLALTHPVPRHVHHHTLAEYLDKKRECGRHSLGRIANLHPQSVADMRLHYVIDVSGRENRSILVRAFRCFADSRVGLKFPEWMGNWPVRDDYSPRFRGLYYQLMNLAVLCCFRRGAVESCHHCA